MTEIEDYLARLEAAAVVLPEARRAELIAELREHIELATGDGAVRVEDVLARLGPPEAIVAAEARESGFVDDGAAPAPRPRADRPPLSTEARALLLLTVGACLLPFVGPLLGLWVAAGSTRWSLRQKRTATLIVVALLALPASLVIPALLAGELTWIFTTAGFSLPLVPLAGVLAAAYLVLSSTVVVKVSRRGV